MLIFSLLTANFSIYLFIDDSHLKNLFAILPIFCKYYSPLLCSFDKNFPASFFGFKSSIFNIFIFPFLLFGIISSLSFLFISVIYFFSSISLFLLIFISEFKFICFLLFFFRFFTSSFLLKNNDNFFLFYLYFLNFLTRNLRITSSFIFITIF